MGELCNSPKKHGGTCGRPAGWGTNHPGTGRCKLHGGRSTGPKDRKRASAVKRGNDHAVKTGENAAKVLSRAEEFARDCAAAPVDPTAMLQEQARRTQGRLNFMYSLLLKTEQQLMDLAAAGDATAISALAVVEQTRKQEPRTAGEGAQAKTELVNVELSQKSRSLLDTWHAQHEAITRVELLYGRTAERLKPKDNEPPPDAGADKLDQLVERMEAAARAASVQPQTS